MPPTWVNAAARMLWRGLPTAVVAAVAACQNVAAQPTAGSQLPAEKNTCWTCHGETDLWEGDTRRLYVAPASVEHDVHFRAGVNCHDCHGGDPSSFDVPVAHSTAGGDQESGPRPFVTPLADVFQSCVRCHQQTWEQLSAGAHAGAGETTEGLSDVMRRCGGCHGETAHGILEVGDPNSPVSPDRLPETCAACHASAWADVASSWHGTAADRPKEGSAQLPRCGDCHGEDLHAMLRVKDSNSPVFAQNQVDRCGACHADQLAEYRKSAHGHGLLKSGLLVTAMCADCHGAHAVYPADNENSTLHVTRVVNTCGNCHRFIAERLETSVHGRGRERAETADDAALDGKTRQPPTCTTCHEGHDVHPETARFRLQLPGRCGNCHREFTDRYAMSMHGELTELGYGPAAMCSDCHGAHDILPISDPDSRLSPDNRQATCAKCHERAPRNFSDFDPHADHRNPQRNLLLYLVYMVLMSFLISTFSFFGIHSILWFARSLVDVVKNGRPKPLVPGAVAYVRFSRGHRRAHTLMVVSFLGLALTGLPLKYSQYEWAQTIAYVFGGYESTGVWHRIFGVINIAILGIYVCRMMGKWLAGPQYGLSRTAVVFGPDSPVPNLRDLKDFLKMIRWFFGLGPKPVCERWSYWEKYDFWGACADIVAIGFTGLVLWFPALFCTYLPGQVLNIAKVVHSTQALLATGFVFAIHFFNTHLRPEKFPMDMSILTGLISEEDAYHERPEYMERLRQAGRLDEVRTTVPSRRRLLLIMLWGILALATGLGLLVAMLLPLVAV